MAVPKSKHSPVGSESFGSGTIRATNSASSNCELNLVGFIWLLLKKYDFVCLDIGYTKIPIWWQSYIERLLKTIGNDSNRFGFQFNLFNGVAISNKDSSFSLRKAKAMWRLQVINYFNKMTSIESRFHAYQLRKLWVVPSVIAIVTVPTTAKPSGFQFVETWFNFKESTNLSLWKEWTPLIKRIQKFSLSQTNVISFFQAQSLGHQCQQVSN